MSDILISALNANAILLANASSNVANMNTQDYKSLKTSLTEGRKGTVETVTTRSTEPRRRGRLSRSFRRSLSSWQAHGS